MVEIFLPLFETIRPTVNFGSPYRLGLKCSSKNLIISSVDIFGLFLLPEEQRASDVFVPYIRDLTLLNPILCGLRYGSFDKVAQGQV